jgi:hypothetical protein
VSKFEQLSGDDLTYIAAVLAVAIAKGLSTSDMNILSNVFNSVGSNLAVIASRNEAAEESHPDNAQPK